ncbi:HAMP domain-containing sensor histidine kinase [Salinisphaera sp. T31B1]|uniref:sensor histidine kinase n=1 Tax=Salinisphaera sp. T31B1 TaxID=727963 RepID=UPI003341C012
MRRYGADALRAFWHSLYARIALVYLASLLVLSVTAAWIAVSQFDQLGREFQQRMQIDLADNLAQVMRAPLADGPASAAAAEAARLILSINPSLSLYVLDHQGRVVGDYGRPGCTRPSPVDTQPLDRLLGAEPMLPVFAVAPCSRQASVFSVAQVEYGHQATPGYLFVVLDAGRRMSMFAMLRTSSITRTLLIAGGLALLLSGILGLLLFAVLTRRFTRLTHAVQRFAEGHSGQRITPIRNDEIGRLGRAFNDMAATIEIQLNALRENDRQRRELVANLSHDFRTPLTSLQGYAERLQGGDTLTSAARRAHLDAILANAARLTQLAEQLSTLARLDAHERPLNEEPFSLAELAYDIAGKFQPQAEAAQVRLEIRRMSTQTLVRADLALIDRLLTNLIDNALQATPPGGLVWLDAVATGDRVQVCVGDTGAGLAEEEIGLVTQRFYRTRAGRERGEGSGLGLSIVEDICNRHGTRLQIDSRPGAGARMMFDLPSS